MEFTVELRYHGGSSTVLSVEAETADQALYDVCDSSAPARGDQHHRPRRDGGRRGGRGLRASVRWGRARRDAPRNASTGTDSAAVTR